MSAPAVTVVVGGASGIGLATAGLLARAGRRLAILDRSERLAQVAAQLREAGAVECATHAVDVTDAEAVTGVADAIGARHAVAGLVNSAGVLQLGSIAEVTPADWDRVLDVNLRGVFNTCRAFLPQLERARGAIVNVSSVSGRTRSIYSAPNYVASKAGVIGLTMVLAAQHAQAGVRVNCVAPGIVETPMLADYSEAARERMLAAIPLGRYADAAEVGEVIAFLLSQRASYVTGQTINVNGGQFMQ
ncbi:SDR family NAD(P)-dependent oxidoreductase [Conexibacter woesei]|uniref:Short-chain dehydrogenase/reductase SDR n=1 Tax=Conexibacter woesei (strain DSM 14684 / CCUG 47730 / CIP 108061 / JCM 11494 / NBRC 100937 / ID131577) TaxID=469383 RepID=D3F393_CONWI|nr:SDR family NAD(P)-dependent oxidoreductase [Conexibacter woesei]ADB50373.1 short-chain dehydrogenase/reductase SDR [Conexibacter woesei DSM 14684]